VAGGLIKEEEEEKLVSIFIEASQNCNYNTIFFKTWQQKMQKRK
jgi:hypothetical protein